MSTKGRKKVGSIHEMNNSRKEKEMNGVKNGVVASKQNTESFTHLFSFFFWFTLFQLLTIHAILYRLIGLYVVCTSLYYHNDRLFGHVGSWGRLCWRMVVVVGTST